jgi:hypothetical protein
MRKWIVISVIVLGVVLAGLCLTGTRGGLAYFSPFTLEYETQSEYTLLDGAWVIYRSPRNPVNNALVNYLRESRVVMPDESGRQRWDSVFHWNDAWKDGFGQGYDVLVRSRESVIDWSKADSSRAQIYWSEAFKCLRSERKETQWAGYEILRSGWHRESEAELLDWIKMIKKEFNVPNEP